MAEAHNPNHTLDQRRQDRDQSYQQQQQTSEIMSALGAIWQPIFSFNALLMRGMAEGWGTIASELGGTSRQQRNQ